MAFTYDPTTSRGEVRLLLSDTDTSDSTKQIFTDAEIDALLSMENNEIFAAAAAGAEALAASTARSAIAYRALGETINRKDIPGHFLKLAERWRDRATEAAPSEEIDSFDYRLTAFGQDVSEYVGDQV